MGLPTPSLSIPLPAGLRLPPLAILRIVQCLLALLTLSFASAVASHYNNQTGTISSPREINFLIFTSLFTLLLILPYTTLTPRYFPRLANAYLMLSAEATSTVFFLAAFASTAHLIASERASPIPATCSAHACSSAIAATIFAAFLFVTFAATTSFAVRHLITSPPLTPKYKRTHYHAHSRDLSSTLALEKQRAHERFGRTSPGCIARPHSDDEPIAYPPPNLKILPRRGNDLEIAGNPFTPRRQQQQPQPVEKSSWSPDSCVNGFFPSSPSSFRRGTSGEVRPYSTKVIVGKVRQGVGEIRIGASEVGGRLKAKMPSHMTYSWFGRERERIVPEEEKGWRRVHEAGEGRRSWRVELQA